MRVLYVLFLLDTLNLAIFIPVFSAFVRSIGGSPFTLGLINSSNALISLLWNPVVGSLSDQIGRKGLLLKCMMASSIGSLILGASSSSLILVFIARLIGGLGSPVQILLRSTVADIFKTDEEKKMFLNKSAPILSLAFLFGSLFSGFLSETKNGYVLTFLMMAVTMAIASFVAQNGLEEDSKPTNTREKHSSFVKKGAQELKNAALNLKTISWPRYQIIFIMKGLYDCSFVTVFSNIGLILYGEYNITGRNLGYVTFTIGLIMILSNIMKLKLKDTLATIPDRLKIISVGMSLLIIYPVIGLAPSVYIFLLSLTFMFFCTTLMDGFWSEMITTKTQEDDKGKVLAAFHNLYPLMSFIVPLLSGIIAEIYGGRVMICSAMMPIFLVVLVAYGQKNKIE